jgi:hypothetical protein
VDCCQEQEEQTDKVEPVLPQVSAKCHHFHSKDLTIAGGGYKRINEIFLNLISSPNCRRLYLLKTLKVILKKCKLPSEEYRKKPPMNGIESSTKAKELMAGF